MSDTEHLIMFTECFTCGNRFGFAPDAVIAVKIDPETGRPPDVDENNQPQEPSPEALQRMVERYVCPNCIDTKINPARRSRGLAPMRVYR